MTSTGSWRRGLAAGALAAVTVVLLAGCEDDNPTVSPSNGGPTTNNPGQTALRAQLTGTSEVPGPGDPDGRGTATVTLDPSTSLVCVDLSVSGIDAATAAHIHLGPSGVAGDIKVTLDPPASGASRSCKQTEPTMIAELAANPDGFYVNVHNAAYPQGAIRGQLTK